MDIRHLEVTLALKEEVLLLVILVLNAIVVDKNFEDCRHTRTL